MANDLIDNQQAIATFPYEDLKDGIGSQLLYGSVGAITGSGADFFLLSPNITWSQNIETLFQDGAAIDFYTGTFNRPRTLFGTLRINCCAYISIGGGTTGRLSVKVYHYDGTNSTQIGSTWTTETYAAVSSRTKTFNIKIPITTAKRFKKGDSVRIEFKADVVTGDDVNIRMGTDPQNRDGTQLIPSTTPDETTQLLTWIPFRTDY